MKSFKSQSAMEYLMTYGWAILIVAVVLAVLFWLGVFNLPNSLPKVQPGGCQVYRPNGPGTTAFINTEGTCNNELPQLVANFDGGNAQGIASTSPITTNAITIAVWVEVKGPNPDAISQVAVNQNLESGADLQVCNNANGGVPGWSYQGALIISSGGGCTSYGVWEQYVGTYSTLASPHQVFYINGVQVASRNTGLLYGSYTSQFYFGLRSGTADNCNCLISNVQVYNTSLSASEVAALYDEGIGGVPSDLSSLVGWWPFNGNSNDYSGNFNNGVPYGNGYAVRSLVFTNSWTSGYATP